MLLALAAVGLSADLHRMRTTGPRPNLLGLGVWLAVALGSLAVQAAGWQYPPRQAPETARPAGTGRAANGQGRAPAFSGPG